MRNALLGGIVLGAGNSRRFGADKRRQTLSSGRPLIEESIAHARDALPALVVVLRAGDQAFAAELEARLDDPAVRTYCAPDSELGMGHSLAGAISQVADWQGACVFLADMPYLRRETIELLCEQFSAHIEDAPIVIPTCNGKTGHPVIFHQRYFPEIAQLEGDQGAKPVVDGHRANVIKVEVDDPGVLRDVDRPEDLDP